MCDLTVQVAIELISVPLIAARQRGEHSKKLSLLFCFSEHPVRCGPDSQPQTTETAIYMKTHF